MLLVRRAEGETTGAMFSHLQSKYDARLTDSEFGPRYKVGPTYSYRGHSFSKICTFAGSLLMQVVIETRQRRFDRAVIYRLDSSEGFRLLEPGGSEVEVEGVELIESPD